MYIFLNVLLWIYFWKSELISIHFNSFLFTGILYIYNYLTTPCIPLKLCVHAWCCKFHNLTDPSLPPDAIKTLLFERVICITGPLWIDFHNFINLLAITSINKKRIYKSIADKNIENNKKLEFNQLPFQSHNLNSPLLWWVIMPVSSLQSAKQLIVSSSWSASVTHNEDITEPLFIDSMDTVPPFWQNKYSASALHCNKRTDYK